MIGYDWQLGHRTISEPREEDKEWVHYCILCGDGYRDLIENLDRDFSNHVLSDEEYSRKLGAVFAYIVSLIYLDEKEEYGPSN